MSLEKFLLKHEPNFFSHLDEFRKRLIISLCCFAFFSSVCFLFSRQILDFLIIPLHQYGLGVLYFHKPYEAFFTHLKAAALAGIIFSSPIIFFQLWAFIAPGLYEREKKIVLPLAGISALLFLFGAWFGYALIVPWGLDFLLSFETEGLKSLLGVGPYFSFVLGMILACAVLFDFPVIMIGLVKFGVLSVKMISKQRKSVIVAVFILSAILTPSPDPISQLLLAVPLMVLFEVSLFVSRIVESKSHI